VGLLRKSARPPARGALRDARTVSAVADHWRLLFALWLMRSCAGLLLWVLRRWRLSGPLAALTYALLRYGWVPVCLTAGALCLCLGVWGEARPASFARRVGNPCRAVWRRWWVYEREWQPACVMTGLGETSPVQRLPRLRSVRSTRDVDRVRVRMLPWHTVSQWEEACPQLRTVFSAVDVRALSVPGRPQEVALRVLSRDPLREPLRLSEPPALPDLAAVPVGVREDGEPLTLPLWQPGRGAVHWLIAGETGAGKGSVVWALLAGVAPLIRDGWVRVWGVDPKGGMELGAAAGLFTRLVWGEPRDGAAWQEPMIELLEDAVSGMQRRAAQLRATGARCLIPSPEDPLILLVVDELAALVAYITDAPLRKRAADALSLLLSQGRAPGVAVLGASQDVRKETVGMRDLFPGRVGLRTAEAGQADLILGRGARDRGARTEGIPRTSPGVAYVAVEGEPEPVRCRFAYADDGDLRRLSRGYAAPPLTR
jgi:DNA segregation ATPase FtsK/SpoIIIE, S-DNA-T family